MFAATITIRKKFEPEIPGESYVAFWVTLNPLIGEPIVVPPIVYRTPFTTRTIPVNAFLKSITVRASDAQDLYLILANGKEIMEIGRGEQGPYDVTKTADLSLPEMVAPIGAAVGGVAGYILKPVDPLVSALIGAGLGAGLGYAGGYLATAGVITIPALGATPEGPGAPARLGKYLVTG